MYFFVIGGACVFVFGVPNGLRVFGLLFLCCAAVFLFGGTLFRCRLQEGFFSSVEGAGLLRHRAARGFGDRFLQFIHGGNAVFDPDRHAAHEDGLLFLRDDGIKLRRIRNRVIGQPLK